MRRTAEPETTSGIASSSHYRKTLLLSIHSTSIWDIKRFSGFMRTVPAQLWDWRAFMCGGLSVCPEVLLGDRMSRYLAYLSLNLRTRAVRVHHHHLLLALCYYRVSSNPPMVCDRLHFHFGWYIFYRSRQFLLLCFLHI